MKQSSSDVVSSMSEDSVASAVQESRIVSRSHGGSEAWALGPGAPYTHTGAHVPAPATAC